MGRAALQVHQHEEVVAQALVLGQGDARPPPLPRGSPWSGTLATAGPVMLSSLPVAPPVPPGGFPAPRTSAPGGPSATTSAGGGRTGGSGGPPRPRRPRSGLHRPPRAPAAPGNRGPGGRCGTGRPGGPPATAPPRGSPASIMRRQPGIDTPGQDGPWQPHARQAPPGRGEGVHAGPEARERAAATQRHLQGAQHPTAVAGLHPAPPRPGPALPAGGEVPAVSGLLVEFAATGPATGPGRRNRRPGREDKAPCHPRTGPAGPGPRSRRWPGALRAVNRTTSHSSAGSATSIKWWAMPPRWASGALAVPMSIPR